MPHSSIDEWAPRTTASLPQVQYPAECFPSWLRSWGQSDMHVASWREVERATPSIVTTPVCTQGLRQQSTSPSNHGFRIEIKLSRPNCHRDLAAVRLFLSVHSSFLTGYSPFSAWPPKASATAPYRECAWREPSTPVGSRNARNQRGETT